VLLILGLVLLVIPFAARLHAAGSGHQGGGVEPAPAPRPLSVRWTHRLLSYLDTAGGGGENVICSPLGFLASLHALSDRAAGPVTRAALVADAALPDVSATLPPPDATNASLWWIHKLFVNNGAQIRPDFVARAATLRLGVEQVDLNAADGALFEEKLSSWLRAVSGGRLKQFHLGGALHSPAQLLLLAAYDVSVELRGFARMSGTQQATFKRFVGTPSSQPIDFLARTGPAGLATFGAAGGTAVKLDLANAAQYVLLCILPPAGTAAEALLGQLEHGGYLSEDAYRRTMVSVRLPAWGQEQTVDLVGGLGELAEGVMTSERANISGVAASGALPLRLTDLRQRVRFQLLEVGLDINHIIISCMPS
jgi:hypothetical protein